VARLLGCPKGTVQSRLARGRDRLRGRLARRGLALSVWALALALAERAAPGAVAEGITHAAARAAAGNGAAGTIPAAVADLTKGVFRAMLLSRLKVAAAGLLALALTGAVVVGGARWALADRPAAARAAQKDEGKILGTWLVASDEWGGQKGAEGGLTGLRLTFAAAGKVTIKHGNQEEEGAYKLDPAKTPRQIDVTANGRELPGIYKLEGDTLTLCVDHGGGARPTEFASKPGTEVHLLTLKREKK
jgi:RNA polymerase sigma-70 factor (ECF subfamily)